ncbi:MAG: peptide deformylase [Bacteroidales bacterium]|nr:peptide deformylase [Bacteroidales bacterium]
MILPICLYGNPILRKQTKDVDIDNPELKQFVADLFETMDNANGVGLAAPQVGRADRVFVIDTTGFKETYPDVEIRREAFINPFIVEEFGDDFIFHEGCLSLPEIGEDVVRKSSVKIQYTTIDGEDKEEVVSGLVARVIQHEYDHLEGQVFTDKLSSLKKMILKRKLSDIATGRIRPAYKTKPNK